MRLISAPWIFVVRVYAQTSVTPIPGTEPNEVQQLKESHPSHNLSTSLEAPQPQFLDPAQQLQQQAQLGMAGMTLASPGPLLTPTAVLERAAQQRRLRQLQREQPPPPPPQQSQQQQVSFASNSGMLPTSAGQLPPGMSAQAPGQRSRSTGGPVSSG